jgi:hypothetical protein
MEHVAYVADVRQIHGKPHLTVMAIYTTTAAWETGVRLPPGVIPVDAEIAQKMRQKSFVMDARKVAFVPANPKFFPRLDLPDKGIIHTASRGFHERVQNTLLELARRPPELVVKLGPDAPGASSRKAKDER